MGGLNRRRKMYHPGLFQYKQITSTWRAVLLNEVWLNVIKTRFWGKKTLKILADVMGMTIFIRTAETTSYQDTNLLKLTRDTGSSEQRLRASANHITLTLTVFWDQPRWIIFHGIVQRLKNWMARFCLQRWIWIPSPFYKGWHRYGHRRSQQYRIFERKSPNKISVFLVNPNWFGCKTWRKLL